MNESPRSRVIVAMSAYNEAKYIGSLVLQAQQYADEVLVVDDGSTDLTSKVAKLAGATVIRHEENKGKGAAIQRILVEANKRTTDILVLMDADSQHDPEEIPSLIKAISEGSDLTIGSRKMQRNNIPQYRRVGQGVLSHLTRVLSRRQLSDTESGFRALSRRAISEIQLKETGFAVEAEMISAATVKGLKITEVPISAIYTKDGSTLNPIGHGLWVLQRIVTMISERRPLLFFGLSGIILMVLGIVAGIIVSRIYLASLMLATGTALISMLLITVGMLSIFTGVILNVLVRRLDGQS
ncbi:glycosyltransferase family 2 protein [Chloroflexota bacterium]